MLGNGIRSDAGAHLMRRMAGMNSLRVAQSLNRLATGSRINRGADGPAGLIAAESLRATLATLDAETAANERASSMATTADGALGEISGLLGEAKQLIAANANDAGLTSEEKAANQLQIDSIVATVDRLANSTRFNGMKLLDGGMTLNASGKSLAIASVASSNLGITQVGGVDRSLLDIRSGKALSGKPQDAARVIDRAINDVATARGRIGAFDRNTLQTRISSIGVARENLLSTVSMIQDTDYAMESSRLARSQMLERASMLAMNRANKSMRISTFSLLA